MKKRLLLLIVSMGLALFLAIGCTTTQKGAAAGGLLGAGAGALIGHNTSAGSGTGALIGAGAGALGGALAGDAYDEYQDKKRHEPPRRGEPIYP